MDFQLFKLLLKIGTFIGALVFQIFMWKEIYKEIKGGK